ncbi:Zn(2)-C6 fungal-type DNA-binding domain protein [Akanthomyces lecanii RCEF 1005]|uniref:Zn(2)-C6 fungal-type DNA-binding domain protein n=1 Tax=Akanthomyces lecanii RCEF 1005 TaxID=1081108 RepID=A0A168C8R8_CORDF|nr:Zn(2)-C6 fungal-type DNA-binding domain protein [Akanthomyces lecanii RCEF 1005]
MAAPASGPEPRHTPLVSAKVKGRDSDQKSPSSSASTSPSSSAVIASPPTENEGTSPPRQKRWATKTRTGCITCRIRRVKCDEAKPMCNRCMTSGRMCDGYKSAPKKPAKQSVADASHAVTELRGDGADEIQSSYVAGSRTRHSILWGQDEGQLIPPEWDLMEAFHYYDSTSAFMPTAGNLGCKTSFITFIFSNRIADAAKNRGTLRSPDDMPHDNYLWTAFHASMITMLAIINERLSSPDGATNDSVFVRIVDMLSIDLTLLGSTWQAHLHGYGALYRMRGGYKRLSKVLKNFDYQFQYVFMLHVLTSTTTPAAHMLTIFDDLTAEEIHHVFTFSLYSDVPCSSHVFGDLIRINRLRALVAAGASVKGFIRPAARQIYHHIAEFSVTDWEEPYGVPDKPEARLLCRLFQQAVLLYGLLTLPSLGPADESSNLPSPEASDGDEGCPDDKDNDDDDGDVDVDGEQQQMVHAEMTPPPSIESLSAEILALVREILPLIPKRPTSLAWPLAVVGVTLNGDGDAAAREFVTQTLHQVSTHRDAYYGPTLALNKLRKFWASGKTGWEDCYDEACSVMA